jgi:integrase
MCNKSDDAKRSYRETLRQLTALHLLNPAEIAAADVFAALKPLSVTGARRGRVVVSLALRYAIITRARTAPDCTAEVVSFLQPVRSTPHKAITDDAGLGAALNTLDAMKGEPGVRAAVRLLPHVFTRPNELRQMQWREVDTDKRLWIIPAERMKMRRPHAVPLSTQALAILNEVELEHDVWVFPGRGYGPIADGTIGIAMSRAGLTGDICVPHGWRSTASTWLNENRDSDPVLKDLEDVPQLVELQLSHVKRDAIAGIYDRSQRLEQRAVMMQRWSDHLDEVKVLS